MEQDTTRLLNVRKAQRAALVRRSYGGDYERPSGERGLSYALLMIVLFQTILLSCAVLTFGGFLLLGFGFFFTRPPGDAYAIANLNRTPSPVPVVSPLALAETATPLPPTPPPTPTATATVIPPTVPPTPTVAALPPAPTLPPTNNGAPQSPVNPALQGYANQVLPPLNNLTGALDAIRALTQNPQPSDPQWTGNINAQIGSIQASHEQLRNLPPPPEAQEVHNTLLNVLNICRSATDAISGGIVTNNPANITAALPNIQNCNAQFPAAANSLREWLRARGVAP
ncbi:MAG: hypothetical protein U0350_27465 [Caldilineaceae bacterium]